MDGAPADPSAALTMPLMVTFAVVTVPLAVTLTAVVVPVRS